MAGNEARVGTALINYAAKDAGFSRTTRKVNRQLTGFEKKAGRAKAAAAGLTASISGMSKGLLGIAASLGGARWLNNFVEQNAKLAVSLTQNSRLLGLTTDELQIIRKAMGEFDISTESTEKALKKFTKSVSDARNGLATQKRAFEALGISAADLERLSTWDLLTRVGKGMREVEDAAKRSGAAMDLFGTRNAEVAVGLGRVDLASDEYIQSIRDTGIASNEALTELEKYIKGTDTLSDIMETKGIEVAGKFAGSLNDIKQSYTELKLVAIDSGLVNAVTWFLEQTGNVLTGWRNIVLEAQNFYNLVAGRTPRDKAIADNIGAPQELIADYRKALDNELKLERRLANAPQFRANLVKAQLEEARIETQRLFLEIQKYEQQAVANATAPAAKPTATTTTGGGEEVVKKALRGIGALGGLTGPQMAAAVARETAARREFENRIQHQQNLIPLRGQDVAARAASEAAAVQARRQEERMREMATAPLNEFGGEGRDVDSSAWNEWSRMMSNIRQQEELASKAIIKLSETTRNRLAPVISGLDNQLNTFFTSIIDGTASASDAFKNLAANIAQAVFQALVLQPLIDSITGGIGGFFGIPVAARAAGGPVASGNPYLVGEKGPELFVPNHAGSIVPNKDMMGGGVTITQHNEFKLFDDTGFEQRMIPIAAAIKEESMKGTMEALQAPGALAN